MTTLSKEDVVRVDNDLLAMIQKHFPSLPLDDRYTDWGKWLGFAKAVYSHGEQAARADLVAENERLKAELTEAATEIKSAIDQSRKELVADWTSKFTASRTALAAAEADNKQLRKALNEILTTDWVSDRVRRTAKAAIAQPRDDSALREMVAGVYEECAKYFDERANWEMFGDRVADDIRALAEKARHGN